MKITPLEIRQKTFEKKLRGYDKDEVNAFLLSLSQEWEQVQDELKELRLKNQNAEKEIKQLREVESSLFKTLKTAEDTGANLIDQANKAAELHLRETQMNADALLNEAKSKAKATIEDAEMRARQILDKMDHELKELSLEYRSLENFRDIILAELRNLANDTINRVEKVEANTTRVDLSFKGSQPAEPAPEPSPEPGLPKTETDNQPKTEPPATAAAEETTAGPAAGEKPPATAAEDEDTSFFDQLK